MYKTNTNQTSIGLERYHSCANQWHCSSKSGVYCSESTVESSISLKVTVETNFVSVNSDIAQQELK